MFNPNYEFSEVIDLTIEGKLQSYLNTTFIAEVVDVQDFPTFQTISVRELVYESYPQGV